MNFVVATLETEHFRFEAFGRTVDEAKDLLFHAWQIHRKQTGASGWGTVEEDINVRQVRLGAAFRDGAEIK